MLKNELRRDNNNNNINNSSTGNNGRPTPSAPSLDEINGNDNHHNNDIHDIDDDNNNHNSTATSITTSLLQHLQNIPIQLQHLYHNHIHPHPHTTTPTTTNTSNNTTANIQNHDDNNNWKSLFQVFCFIFILYIAFGGRFGLSSDIYNRANYGSGNAYDEFYNSGRTSRSSRSSRTSMSSSSSGSCNSGDDVNSDSCKTKDYFDNRNTGDTYYNTRETDRQNTYRQQPKYNHVYNDGDNYNDRSNNQYYGDRYSSYGKYGRSSGSSGGRRNYHNDQSSSSSYGSYSSRNNRGRHRSDSANWDMMIPYVIVGGVILLLNKVLGVPIHFMPLGFGLNRGLGGHFGEGGIRFGFGPGGGIRFGLGPGGLGLGGGYYGGGGRFHRRRRHNGW